MRRWLAAGVFTGWAGVMVTLAAFGTGAHYVAFAGPTTDVAAEPFVRADAAGRWQMVHVLSDGCRCSEQTIAHLVSRGVATDAAERVWYVGGPIDPAVRERLVAKGFDVTGVDGETLARTHGIDGGPWLVIVAPDGRTAYSGGYAAGRVTQSTDPKDLQLLTALRRGEPVDALPAFGCATKPELKLALDPLRLNSN